MLECPRFQTQTSTLATPPYSPVESEISMPSRSPHLCLQPCAPPPLCFSWHSTLKSNIHLLSYLYITQVPQLGYKPLSVLEPQHVALCPAPCCCLVTELCLFCDPMDCSPPGSFCPWDFPGKNTGVGCSFLLQDIFPTQGSNPCRLHWQADSLPELPGKPSLYLELLPKQHDARAGANPPPWFASGCCCCCCC